MDQSGNVDVALMVGDENKLTLRTKVLQPFHLDVDPANSQNRPGPESPELIRQSSLAIEGREAQAENSSGKADEDNEKKLEAIGHSDGQNLFFVSCQKGEAGGKVNEF